MEQLSRDGSHYSLSGGILPSLGARSSRSVKLRCFIISPFDARYRSRILLSFHFLISGHKSIVTCIASWRIGSFPIDCWKLSFTFRMCCSLIFLYL